MNLFPFKKARAVVMQAARQIHLAPRPHAVWVRDPETGRLVQTWQGDDDSERSCTGRPIGPPRPPGGRAFPRAA